MRPLEDRSPEPDIYRDRFERCFDEHYLRIFAFAARRVSGRESAEDVVADTFAIAWRRRDRIPEEALPWLYAIAANVIANQYRSSHRRHNLDERLAELTARARAGLSRFFFEDRISPLPYGELQHVSDGDAEEEPAHEDSIR